MKKLYTILAVLMTFFYVSAQTAEERNRLVVTEKSGTQTAFKVENIESISFEYVNESTDGFGVDITCSSIDITGATITFTPNEASTYYIARVMSKKDLQSYQCYDKNGNLDDAATLKYVTNNPYIDDYAHTGTYTMTLTNLIPGTEYVALAFEYYTDVDKVDHKEFKTSEGEIDAKFVASDIVTDYRKATVNITAKNGGEAWTYYLMEKEWYLTYDEPVQNCYYGLYNTFVLDPSSYNNSFSEYLKSVALYGDQTITLDNLESDKEYVLAVFNIDINTTDPTQVYDWYYLPVEFKTLTPSQDNNPEVDVFVERIEQNTMNYYIYFTVHLNEAATEAYDKLLPYNTFGSYYQEGGWDNVGDLFHSPYGTNHSLTEYDSTAIEQAKSPEGFTFVSVWPKSSHEYYKSEGNYNYGLCITIFTEQGVRAQNGVIVTANDLENSDIKEDTTDGGTLKIDISSVSINPTNATIKFSPSDPNTEYVARMISKSEMTASGLINADGTVDELATLAYLLRNPFIDTYKHVGDYEMYINNLRPESEYVAVAFEYFTDVMNLDYFSFSTPKGDTKVQFAVESIDVDYTKATIDVTALNNGGAWTYYLMKKEWYITYDEPIQNCYYGLYNTFVIDPGKYNNSFSEYLQSVALYGDQTITLTNLESDKEYVLALFNIDINTADPTEIYDWRHLPVEFKTLTPGTDNQPTVDFKLDRIEQDDINYYIYVNLKVNDVVTEAYDKLLPDNNFKKYYEEGGWDNMGDIFHSPSGWGNHNLTAYDPEAITKAKSADGYTFKYTWPKSYHNEFVKYGDVSEYYGLCVTVFTEQASRAQNGLIIYKEDLENSNYAQ